ncbi:Receptor homology region, transmembrane domain- and RING domain-containing protein 3 [Smittium culicis]|uniref:RING-type E3 ubiquitin transferase n=1 Tax=Smittium culicis TaxID=133412 RepID=A0A1R1X5V1_9FUNG|nr:Receptor homology region, transmembrane domain- and RING domain-containing protein 3 [Smittium culicis]
MKFLLFLISFSKLVISDVSIRKDIVVEVNRNSVELDYSISYDKNNTDIQLLSNSKDFNDVSGSLYLFTDPVECIPVPSVKEKNHINSKNNKIALVSIKNCGLDIILDQMSLDGAKGAIIYDVSSSSKDLKESIDTKYKNIKYRVPIYIVNGHIGSFTATQLNQIEYQNYISGQNAYLGYRYILASKEYKQSKKFSLNESRDSIISKSDLKNFTETKVSHGFLHPEIGNSSHIKNSSTGNFMEPESLIPERNFQSRYLNFVQRFIKPKQLFPKTPNACLICVQDFVIGVKVRSLPCGHSFHVECIDHLLLKKSSLCPVCKKDTRKYLRRISFDTGILNQEDDHINARYCRQ